MNILKVLTDKRKIGNIGEDEAAKLLRKKKYKILERSYCVFDSEIDIIAENKTTLAFVEVKTRTLGHENPKEPRPASSVTPEKQRKIIKAAKYYIGSRPSEKHISLDVIEVYLNERGKAEKILHFENAFNLNSSRKAK